MKKRKICVVTGSRADYGYLREVMSGILQHSQLELQTIVTGSHLSPEFGLTSGEILRDGFEITEKIEMLLCSDTPCSNAKSAGLGSIGFADAFERLKPDLVLLMGDRFEIFAAAQSAFLMGFPIAHLAGGDLTEGAFDEGLRHAITKLAHFHFPTNVHSARVIEQMGEEPRRIFLAGSTGLDALLKTRMLTRSELEEDLTFCFQEKNLIATFHPVTEEPGTAGEQFEELLGAIETLLPQWGVIMTYPNADAEGRLLVKQLEDFGQGHKGVCVVKNLGLARYASVLHLVDVMVGNSSSGIYEAASFSLPVVNIGNRQKGRFKPDNVIDCAPRRGAILEAIGAASRMDRARIKNPFGNGGASAQIIDALVAISDWQNCRKKKFLLAAGRS
jgi:UDP-hydrolysing UDP-N-acetyl-D-glucosamine 2-epimerase